MNDEAKTPYEEALDKGYWGSVPAETTATQPLQADGEPAVVAGQPATVDVPVDDQHPLTPHPEDVQPAATPDGTVPASTEGGPSATETPATPTGDANTQPA